MEPVSCKNCKYSFTRYNQKGDVKYKVCTNQHPQTPIILIDLNYSCSEWEQKVNKGV
jgi:hypothetical protein